MTPLDLRSTRKRLGLSQEALAQYLGVHKLTISHWERGRYRVPGHVLVALKAIERTLYANCLNVSALDRDD